MADPKKRLPLLPLLLVVSLAGVAGEQPSVDEVMRTVQAAVGSGGKAPPRDVLQKFQNRVKQLSDGLEAAGGAPLAYDVDLSDPAAHQRLLGMIREGTRRMEELKAAARHDGREIEDPPRKTPRTSKRRYVRPPKPGKAANKDEEEEMSPDEIIAFLETELDKQTKLAEAFRTAPSQCADYAELNGASEEKVAALEADAGKLGRENRDLRQQLGRLEADKDRLTKQVRNLEEDVDQARHDAKWYETEMGRLVMDIKLAADVHKEDRKEVKQLKKDKATAFAAKKDLKQQLSEAASELNRTRIERDFLQKENSALQGSIDSCEARLDGIMEQVNSVKSGDADRTKYKEAVTKLHQCTQDFGRCSMTNSYLNAKSEAMDQWKAQYEREIKALASLGGCSPDLQLNHTKCKQANADLQAQVRGLSDRFTDARKAASDCQSELKENKRPRDAIVEELKEKTEYYKKGLEEAKGVQERYAKCVQQNKACETLEQDYQKCMAGQTSGPVEGGGAVADGDLRARLEECQASRQAMVEVGDRYHTCVRRRVELMDVEEKYAACVREKADVERRVDADGMVRDEYNTCTEKRKALERERREFDEKIAACQKLEAECSAAECPAPTPAPCDCGSALQKCEGDARDAADMYVDCKKTRQGFKVSRYFVKKENAMLKANVTRLEAELAAAEVRLLELQADGGAAPGGADSGCAGSLQVCQQMLQALAQQKVHVEAADPGEDKDTLRQELETAQAEAASCQSSLSVAQTMMKNLALQSGIPGAEKIPGQATGSAELEAAEAEAAACRSSLAVAQNMVKSLALQAGVQGAESIPTEGGSDEALKAVTGERDELLQKLEQAEAEAASCQSSLSVAQIMMKNLALQSGIPGAENIPREAGETPPVPELYNPEDAAPVPELYPEGGCSPEQLEQVTDERNNCVETMKISQGKLGACSGDLAGVRARATELEAGYTGCMEQLAEAQAKQQQAEFLKNGMEMIVSKQDENDKEAKEKYEKIARRAKRAEIYFRKYFYPVLGALLLLLAYNVFQFIRWRYDVSVEAAQLTKQRAREEKKKKK